ncbi:MAG: Holliday junction branch migration DNA helicase RuvB [Acidimicrobiia bacterium]
MRDERLLDPGTTWDDELERTLRPQRLGEFIGQAALKERLSISIEAARSMERPLDHLLLSGPPGLGKTTLAGIVANELGARIQITSGPALERPGDLAAILSNLDEGDVFFIDEVHRLPRTVEEVLYTAMEDFQLDVVLGKGPAAQSIRLTLPRFTLVGATTRLGMVASPLRDRFGIVDRLDHYDADELAEIVRRSASILDIAADDESAEEIARRARGTPRVANRLLARVRDYAVARSDGTIDPATTGRALEVFQVDELGLDPVDRAILRAIAQRFGGGPVGLSTLAVAVGEEPDTVEEAYEPYLLIRGLLQRTPRGRTVTTAAYLHLGLQPPADAADADDTQGRLL